MKTCFATIASGNYLAYVKVLAESVARHSPDVSMALLVVDRRTPALEAAVSETGISATFAEDLGLVDFEQLAFKFDVVELNTALKPTFLKSLFARGFDRVVYLDPDIRLFAPPTPVLDALGDAEIVLTPHALAPVMDGKRPSDIDYLRTGSFNLGFIGLRRGPDALAFLDWWERRCLGQGFNDFSFGVFVDQKWVDLAPCYFASVRVLRHPGCNVAYWNLHERHLESTADGSSLNGRPLVFFHFSGVNPKAPTLLSRHQNRHVPLPGSPLAQLVQDYCAALVAAGHARYQKMGYGFAHLDDGTPITSLMRRASCTPGMDSMHPFNAGSPLQAQLRAHGLVEKQQPPATGGNTLNFDPTDRRVRFVNAVIRGLVRLAGAERVRQLLQYATFLGWGSNYPAVLLKRAPDITHRDPR